MKLLESLNAGAKVKTKIIGPSLLLLLLLLVFLPMLLIVLTSIEVNIERGTSGVMGTTATVARFDAMCFLVSFEPVIRERERLAIQTQY